MSILKVGWLGFLVLLLAAGGGGYYLYRQQDLKILKHMANKEEIKKLEEKQRQEVEWELEDKRGVEVLKELSRRRDKWWFLHDIEEELGEEFKPLFRSIGPMKVNEKQDYLYISRKLVVTASYPELIGLLENLERERGFSIENLKISASSGGDQHEASFILSTVEVKKGFLDELLYIEGEEKLVAPPTESLLLPPTWGEEQRLVLKAELADPFVRPSQKELLSPEASAILPPIDISSKYRLEGIINFPEYRLAIIGPDYILREGDWLDNMQVLKIDSRRVSLIQDEQEYFMAIPGFAGTEDEINIEETPGGSVKQQPEYPVEALKLEGQK